VYCDLYNLIQSLFLQLVTNKFHLYDIKCGILIKFGLCRHIMLFSNVINTSQTWFLGMEITDHFLSVFIYWWNDFTSM